MAVSKKADPKSVNLFLNCSLEPLTDENALYLAKCFNEGCELNLEEPLMKHICQKCDNIPYFIDALFAKIRNKKIQTQESLDEVFNNELLSDTNRFKHFDEKIDFHYQDKKDIAFKILNIVCQENELSLESEIHNLVASNLEITPRYLLSVMERLTKDEYLIREIKEDKRAYRFKYEILRSWWKLNKAI